MVVSTQALRGVCLKGETRAVFQKHLMVSNCAQWSLVWPVVTVKNPPLKSHMLMKSRHGGYVNADELETNSYGQPRHHFLCSRVKRGQTESNCDTRVRRTSDLSSSGEIIHGLKTQPRLEPAAEHKLYPTLSSQPQETGFYLHSQ